MKKVLEFLEKYAEFLAIGVAVLFLGLVVYSYIVSPEALKSKVAGKLVLPGDVDPAVAQKANLLLDKTKFTREDAKLNDSRVPSVDKLQQLNKPPVPDEVRKALTATSFAAQFQRAMGEKPVELTINFRPGVPLEQVEKKDPQEVPKGLNLPKPPAAIPVRVAAGISNFSRGANAQAFDSAWATYVFKIDTIQLRDAWLVVYDPKKMPQGAETAMSTKFLRFEVEREEAIGVDAAGNIKWGKSTRIEALPNSPQADALKELVWPDGGKFGNRDVEATYLQAAEKHQMDILLPPFYPCLAGDPWPDLVMGLTPKADKDPAVTPIAEPFDPANPPKDRELTSDEKRAVYIYNQKKKAEEQKQKAPPINNPNPRTPTPRPGGGGRGGAATGFGGNYNAMPMDLLAAAQERPSGEGGRGGRTPVRTPPARPVDPRTERPEVPPTGRPIMPPREEGTGGTPMTPRDPNTVTQSISQSNPTLTGEFNPITLVDGGGVGNPPEGGAVNPGGGYKEITGWAHDETAESGKTYRYRVRYYLKNPLYQTLGLLADPTKSDQMWIMSDWSTWEVPEAQAKIPRDIEFYFASEKKNIAAKSTSYVTVDVFKRHKGTWVKESFNVTPGDSIGQKKGDVGFLTGATVVDLRNDVRDKTRIIISNANGQLESRTIDQDMSDPRHKELMQKLNAPKPDGTPGGEVPTGIPAGGNEAR